MGRFFLSIRSVTITMHTIVSKRESRSRPFHVMDFWVIFMGKLNTLIV